jgi:hypothetical protein
MSRHGWGGATCWLAAAAFVGCSLDLAEPAGNEIHLGTGGADASIDGRPAGAAGGNVGASAGTGGSAGNAGVGGAGEVGGMDASDGAHVGPTDAPSEPPPVVCNVDLSDPCAHIPRLPAGTNVQVDGDRKECPSPGLSDSDGKGSWSGVDSRGVRVEFAAAMVPPVPQGGLWVFARVHKPNTNVVPPATGSKAFGDALEIYVDSDGDTATTYDNPGTRQFVIWAPGSGQPTSTTGWLCSATGCGTLDPWGSSLFGSWREGDGKGYSVEAIIQSSDLGGPSFSSSRIGFDLGLDTCDPSYAGASCPTDKQRPWLLRGTFVSGPLPYKDKSTFCRPTIDP